MSTKRKRHSAQFKFQIALEAIKETKTVNQIASEHNLHPNQVSQWKRQLLDSGPSVFSSKAQQHQQEQLARETDLYEQIGRLKMELEWLKKKVPDPVETKRAMIEPNHPTISIRRQCALLGLNRATLSTTPAGESPLNLQLMRVIDEQYTRTPYYGYLKMTAHLRQAGYAVNHKRIQRLMQIMDLQAVHPRVRTSQCHPEHQIYPYLLRNLEIVQPNQVWCADITYIPLLRGFMYLVAIMDWFSRYVLAWQLSNTLDVSFCLVALQRALQQTRPMIFNTDQGAQFTARAFSGTLEAAGVRVSMDGRGRVFDNIFIERLWRSVKYEDIYLHNYETVPALTAGLETYFVRYNEARPHQSLAYQTPAAVYLAHGKDSDDSGHMGLLRYILSSCGQRHSISVASYGQFRPVRPR